MAIPFITGQTLVINEFSSLNIDYLDEDNDASDWIELYNAGNEAINLLDYSLSDDTLDILKWKFPEILLPSKNTILVFASGKDRKELTYYNTLIEEGDNFQYALGSAAVSSNWKAIDYDASTWQNGPSGFGFGDNDDATIISDGTLSVFVRNEFNISDVSQVKELILHMDYDDGFVAYMNGVEIARANLGTPNTNVPYNQTADTYIEPLMARGNPPERFDINNVDQILKTGKNVLCIQIHNQSTTSSDLTLIPFLTLGYTSPELGGEVPDVLNLEDKVLHTNFKISADGEKIFLSNPVGVLVDQSDSIPLALSISYGREHLNLTNWQYFKEPTPDAINTTNGYDDVEITPITFSPEGGKFDGTQYVYFTTSTKSDVYYTTDGTEPDINSKKFIRPVIVDESTVIKAKVLDDNVLSLNSTTHTYIIESRDFDLPVISLSTDPYNMFDWNYGIYVMGPNAETNTPHFDANFWMDWERPIFIEYFDKSGTKVFESPGGVKIFGGWSRANDQRSMSLFARKAYGNSTFDYPFFDERENSSFASLVLRNSGNDWGSTAFRDAMMTGLVREVDLDRQAYQPTIVYINGEYWGILNLREKVNEKYLEANHPGVDSKRVDILQSDAEVVEGTNEHYLAMMDFIQRYSPAISTHYDSIKKMMDVSNFMDYQVAEIYYNNTDWPGNNIKYWRPQTVNGKWRWILYDTDFGFGIWGVGDYANNTLAFALDSNGPNWPNPPWSTYLLRRMVLNNQFKKEFINRFADRLNYNFKQDKVIHLIDSLSGNIDNEIPFHHKRWNNLWNYNSNVANMRIFASQRPSSMRNHVRSQFGLGGNVVLVVNVNDSKAGRVQVNTLNLKSFPWSGTYFLGNAVPVKAIANPGYEFSHWMGSSSLEPELDLSIPGSGKSLTAVFKSSTNPYNSIVINEINNASDSENNSGDWVELYNTTGADIDITGWTLKDDDDLNAFSFTMGTTIPKNGYLVVCRDQNNFSNVFPNVHHTVGDMQFGLSSITDMVRIYDQNETLVDSVWYWDNVPWPYAEPSQTFELVNPTRDNANGENWMASAMLGTPGTLNGVYTGIPDQILAKEEVVVSCFPNPSNGPITVRWSNNVSQQVQLIVMDVRGVKVAQLYNGKCQAGTFEEVWTPKNGAKSGIYFIQVIYENGLSKTLKVVKQ